MAAQVLHECLAGDGPTSSELDMCANSRGRATPAPANVPGRDRWQVSDPQIPSSERTRRLANRNNLAPPRVVDLKHDDQH